jgi:TonB family protein
MKNEHILTPSVFALVALLHIGLMSLLWQSAKPAQVTVQHIEFVDLSDLGSGGGQPESAPAPPPPPKVVPPKPRPVEPAKPVLKPVVTKNDKADIRQVPEKPKPVEQPKPKPKQETPEPKPKPAEQVAERPVERPAAKITAAEGRGSGERSGGNHSSARGEGGAGGSAANAIRATGSIARPPYPTISQENGEEGTVVLKIMVSPDGKVTNVGVAKSSGFARLDRAARNAGKNGRFQPNGWTEYTVPVSFKLQ